MVWFATLGTVLMKHRPKSPINLRLNVEKHQNKRNETSICFPIPKRKMSKPSPAKPCQACNIEDTWEHHMFM